MNELISMIVPIYNGEVWMELFFEQFEEQTYSNLELILVDDGSTDNTACLCDEYARNKDNVIVFHKNNGGPSSARNCGLRSAKGHYIVFADVDDRIYPTYVEYLYKLVIGTGADMSVCSYVKMSEGEKYDKYLERVNKEFHVFSNKQIIHNFCYRKYINGYCYLKLIKADIAKQVEFPEDIVFGEDYIYVYGVLKRCKKVVCGEQIQYVYIQYKNSSTHLKKDNTLNYQKAWKKHLEVLNDAHNCYHNSYEGMLEKCFLLAINNMTRIYDINRDKEFLEELTRFIKYNTEQIIKSKNTKKISKLLGILGMLNIRILFFACKLFFICQKKMGMTFRKTQ